MGMESQVTAEFMLKYGVNNVRGSYLTHARNYTVEDISKLIGFIGHYNQLSYKQLQAQLLKTLPQPSSQVPTNFKKNDICFQCGELGHWANECPQNNDQPQSKIKDDSKNTYVSYKSIDGFHRKSNSKKAEDG
jgi:hypothetical protein